MWDEWHQGYKGDWQQSPDVAWEGLHDAKDININTLHHFAQRGPGGMLAYDDYLRVRLKPLEEWIPTMLTARDHVPYVLGTLDPLKYCPVADCLYRWNPLTGI